MKFFEKLIIEKDTSILESMKIINNEALKIVLVAENKKLLGTITDGDIRRGIINGIDLKDPVKEIMNKNFIYLRKNQNRGEANLIMKKNFIKHLPILDEDMRIIDFLFSNDQSKKNNFDNTVLIMAGGRGKRLMPYTENCPKPLLEVGGMPIIETILKNCIENGFSKFIFSVHYLKEQIIKYFGDGSNWGVTIKYIEENKPLGTAGCLSLIKDEDFNKPLIVMNGDVLNKLNLSSLLNFHNKNKYPATICVRSYPVKIPFGVINTAGNNLKNIEEKPVLNFKINAGIYVLDPLIKKMIKNNQFLDMPDLINILLDGESPISVFPIHEYWLDIGRKELLEQAHKDWEENFLFMSK